MFKVFKIGVIACVMIASQSPRANAIKVDKSNKEWSRHAEDSDSSSIRSAHDDDLAALINYLSKEGFDIQKLLDDPRFEIYEDIADRFRYSAEKKSLNLKVYKDILDFSVKKQRIIKFINKHKEQLEKAEKQYGIPRYVISAIIGVESNFGQVVGSYNPFNAYVSMCAANYREDFARAQLKHLLIFTRKNDIDVFDLKSSYAGAMTFAQFIPYSMNKWFIGDEIMNMDNSILSVANYLSYFKERTGSIETAVLRYNPSSLYTKAVLDLAKSAEKYFSEAG